MPPNAQLTMLSNLSWVPTKLFMKPNSSGHVGEVVAFDFFDDFLVLLLNDDSLINIIGTIFGGQAKD